MEQSKTIFTVICNDEKYLKDSLDWYNSINQTDFKIKRYILDEVNFAEIEVFKFQLTDIFNIGYVFGTKEQKLREKGEIDW